MSIVVVRAPDGSIVGVENDPFKQRVIRGNDGRIVAVEGESLVDTISNLVQELDQRISMLEGGPREEPDSSADQIKELTAAVGGLARKIDKIQRVVEAARKSLDAREQIKARTVSRPR